MEVAAKVFEFHGDRIGKRRGLPGAYPLSSEQLEKMPQCGPDSGSRTPTPGRASATWHMLVKEPVYQFLVHIGNRSSLPCEPVSKMRDTSEVTRDRRRGITAAGKILDVSICVATEFGTGQPPFARCLRSP